MTNEPELNAVPDVCPFLGLADDQESHATFATDAHRCFKLERPTRVAAQHQEAFCISSGYERCPVYRGDGIPQGTRGAAAATPASTRPSGRAAPPGPAPVAPGPRYAQAEPAAPEPATSRQPAGGGRPRRDAFASGPGSTSARQRPGTTGDGGRRGLSMPVATIALFVLAVAVVAVAVFVLNQGDDDAPPIDDESATRTAQAADDETPTEGDETPSTPADGTPGAETATEDPDATPAAETPTAGGGEEGTYEVVAGDTCGGIATSEGITLQELLDANGLTEEDCLNIQPGDILEIP